MNFPRQRKTITAIFGLFLILFSQGCATPLLPGESRSFDATEEYTFIALVVALDDAKLSSLACRATEHTFSAVQTFRVLEIIKGESSFSDHVTARYWFETGPEPSQRPIRKGERVIAGLSRAGSSVDVTAGIFLRNTARNRALVSE